MSEEEKPEVSVEELQQQLTDAETMLNKLYSLYLELLQKHLRG